jgi:hypothetical protein
MDSPAQGKNNAPSKPLDSASNLIFAFFQGPKTSIVFSTICIFFMLLFGFIFFYANISVNGNTKSSIFAGYCISAWILLVSLVLILRIIHDLIGF